MNAAPAIEVNFDGLIGPTHNYAGLSLGNVASATNAGAISRPRDAALQGLGKMRRLMELGLVQGFLPPQERPDVAWLRQLGFMGEDAEVCAQAWRADPALLRNASSASAMWTANAATVSPAWDTASGRCEMTAANLATMPHRSIEGPQTARLLRTIFADERHFSVHDPLPACFGDEGAANHMRMAPSHGAPGVEIFVFGERREDGRFPARQDRRASMAVARRHGLDPDRTFFAQQSHAAIQAGAFHNDVVAVANEDVLFAHEQAFEDRNALYAFISGRLRRATVIEAPADRISLDEAIRSYLFNSQLVTLPEGGMALIVPAECQESGPVRLWLEEVLAGGGPIRRVEVMNVRESMRNGGGPACLRLRVCLAPEVLAAVDPRFLLDERRWEALHRVVEARWPEAISPADLGARELWETAREARRALFESL